VLDTVGWVIWPVKIVPDMTYNVFGGTLNPTTTHSNKRIGSNLEGKQFARSTRI